MTTQTKSKNIIILASIAAFIVAFISTAPTVALPQIATEFNLTNLEQNWLMNIFLFVVAIFTVPFGKISGKIGIKKSFIIGTLIFLIGCFLTVFAVNNSTFLIYRGLQGLGAAFIYDTMTTILVLAVEEEKRGSALGILISCVFIGLALAPVLGGIFTYNVGWRGIFYFAIPFCLVVLWMLFTKVHEEWKPYAEETLDKLGSILYAVGILLTIYGFNIINSTNGVLTTILGIIFLIGFTLCELKVKTPIFNMRLFSNKVFTCANVSSFISYIATFIVTYLLSYHFQYVLGFDAQTAGLLLVVNPLVMAIVAPISGKISDEKIPQKVASLGMGIVAIGMIILIFVNQTTPIWVIIFAMILEGAGLGIFSSPNTNVIMSSVPERDTPFASVSLTFMRVVGQSISLVMLTIVFTFIMGDVIISSGNLIGLTESAQITFTISAILCIIATFASLVGLHSKNKEL